MAGCPSLLRPRARPVSSPPPSSSLKSIPQAWPGAGMGRVSSKSAKLSTRPRALLCRLCGILRERKPLGSQTAA